MKSDIIVIGGGASGLVSAISAARCGASVTILERMPKLGKKLLATGNGRCNYTNRKLNKRCYHTNNPVMIESVIKTFGWRETEDFFGGLGILPKEKEGYVYPNSMQASSILDALVFELERLKVQVVTDCHVDRIEIKGKGFQIHCKNNVYHCRKVILAAGGCASSKLGSDGSGFDLVNKLGYKLIPTVPALTGLKAKEKVYKSLGGIRTEGKVTLYIDGKKQDSHVGELQLADYGISGIPVFQLSGQAAYGLLKKQSVVCELDFFPDWNESELIQYLKERKKRFKSLPVEVFETGLLNRKLIHEAIRMSGKTDASGYPDMVQLAKTLKHFRATIYESRGYEFAQVCAGGISLDDVCKDSFESLRHKGLYFAGEILDVDGICGGYNLQWAWATGFLSGRHAGKECHASRRTN